MFSQSLYFILLLLVFPFGTLFLTLAKTEGGVGAIDAPVTVLSGMVITWSAIRIIALAKGMPKRVIGISFYVFIYIWLGLIPIYQLGSLSLSWRTVLPVEYYHFAYLLVIAGIIFYEIGYRWPIRRRAPLRAAAASPSVRRIVWFGVVAIALALWFGPLSTPIELLFAVRDEVYVGLEQLGRDRVDRLLSAALMRTPVSIAFLVTLWRLRVDAENRLVLGVLLLFLLPVFLMVNFPGAVSRTWLGTLIIATSLVVVITSTRPRATLFPLMLVVGLLTVFPVARFAGGETAGAQRFGVDHIVEAYSAGSFDVFAMLGHTVYYFDKVEAPVTYGYQLLGPLLFWVPRSIWLDKPIGTGQLIAEELGFLFANVSGPLWSEGLINFHLAGVALMFFMFGLGSRKLELDVEIGSLPTFRAFLWVFLAGFQFIILRGDLLTAMTIFVPFIIFVAMLFYRPGAARANSGLGGR